MASAKPQQLFLYKIYALKKGNKEWNNKLLFYFEGIADSNVVNDLNKTNGILLFFLKVDNK